MLPHLTVEQSREVVVMGGDASDSPATSGVEELVGR